MDDSPLCPRFCLLLQGSVLSLKRAVFLLQLLNLLIACDSSLSSSSFYAQPSHHTIARCFPLDIKGDINATRAVLQ